MLDVGSVTTLPSLSRVSMRVILGIDGRRSPSGHAEHHQRHIIVLGSAPGERL
jgi:hypothetical protein